MDNLLCLNDNTGEQMRNEYYVVMSHYISRVINDNGKIFLTDSDANEETANKMVHAVLADYLESVLPVPSSFELPLDYRNKFLHASELARWQMYRSALTIITYSCIIFLIIVSIAGKKLIPNSIRVFLCIKFESNFYRH